MSKQIKLVVIGGGSSYTPELIEGFIKRKDELPLQELWLVDVEKGKEKQDIIYNLTKRMLEANNMNTEVHQTLNRRDALKNADFVITQLRVGQLDARLLDETIPGKYGLLGQETVGIGGAFKAIRTIPVIYDIIKDIEELAPKAWLINFTNPAGIVSEAVFRYTNFEKFIGVCNVPINLTNHFAKLLNTKSEELIPYFAGLNHFSYVLNIYKNGKSVFPTLLKKLREEQITMNNIDTIPISMDFIEQMNAYPSPYHKYYYLYEEMYNKFKKDLDQNHIRANIVKELENELFEIYKDKDLDKKPEQLERRGGAYYSDVACSIISSIHNDKKEFHVVNTTNNGYIKDLPEGAAIEITSRITKYGASPVYIGELPQSIKGDVIQMKNFEEILVDGIFEKNLNKIKHAIQVHPLTKSINNVNDAFDELVEAHKEYMGFYYE